MIKNEPFHAHLDVCSMCRNHPFMLCQEGVRLLFDSFSAAEQPLAEPATDADVALAIMTLLTPLVADAAIVGRRYGWTEILEIVHAVHRKYMPTQPQHYEIVCAECGWGKKEHTLQDGVCFPGKCTCGHPYRYHMDLSLNEQGQPLHACRMCKCYNYRFERRRGKRDRRALNTL